MILITDLKKIEFAMKINSTLGKCSVLVSVSCHIRYKRTLSYSKYIRFAEWKWFNWLKQLSECSCIITNNCWTLPSVEFILLKTCSQLQNNEKCQEVYFPAVNCI